MLNFKRAGLILLGIALVIFASTYMEKRETTAIPFSTPSGYSGSIVLDLPVRVIAGDKTKVKARVSIAGSHASQTSVALAGRLEAGFEELSPPGRVSVNLVNGSDVELVWTLRSLSAAQYPGNLWLWLVSDTGEELLLVRELNLDSRSYLGLQIIQVRVGMILLMVVSLMMLGFDLLKRSRRKLRQD